MLSRRGFLRSGTLAALCASFAARTGGLAFGQGWKRDYGVGFQIPDQVRADPLFYYTRAAFEPCVGSTFTALGARGSMIDLRLARVSGFQSATKYNPLTPEPDCFSLAFTSSEALAPFTSIHTMQHDVLGKFDLFVVHGGAENDLITYVAVINHIGPAPAGLPPTGIPTHGRDESPRVPAPDAP
jgi:hypothetical protein